MWLIPWSWVTSTEQVNKVWIPCCKPTEMIGMSIKDLSWDGVGCGESGETRRFGGRCWQSFQSVTWCNSSWLLVSGWVASWHHFSRHLGLFPGWSQIRLPRVKQKPVIPSCVLSVWENEFQSLFLVLMGLRETSHLGFSRFSSLSPIDSTFSSTGPEQRFCKPGFMESKSLSSSVLCCLLGLSLT